MTQYAAYFDTSGSETDKNSMLVTVGAISTVAKWERFDRQWLTLMKKYDVTSFRMTDFENSTGDYAGWAGDQEARDAFMEDLTGVMCRGINKVLVRSLVLPDYQEFNVMYCLDERVGGPYSLTQAATLLLAVDWLYEKKNPKHDTFLAAVELGDSGQQAFKKFIRKNAPIEVTFSPKKDPKTGEPFTPLNACDLIAGQHRRLYVEALRNRRLKDKELWPKYLQQIRKKLAIEATMLDGKFLKHFCETLNIERRPA